MPYAGDEDFVAGHEIADDVGRYGGELPKAVARRATSIGVFAEALTSGREANSQFIAGINIELTDISADRVDRCQRVG